MGTFKRDRSWVLSAQRLGLWCIMYTTFESCSLFFAAKKLKRGWFLSAKETEKVCYSLNLGFSLDFMIGGSSPEFWTTNLNKCTVGTQSLVVLCIKLEQLYKNE